jgi:hypothetical protein
LNRKVGFKLPGSFWASKAVPMHRDRFSLGKLLIANYLSFFDKKQLTNGIDWFIFAP